MDRSDVIKLIAETATRDQYGIFQKTETSREVYAQVDSVTGSEFFEGGRNGLNPELRFRMFAWDYKGERIVEHNGARFAVYRTYLGRDDTLELYTERQGGTNGAPDTT